jgi:hypothetical protein
MDSGSSDVCRSALVLAMMALLAASYSLFSSLVFSGVVSTLIPILFMSARNGASRPFSLSN